MKKLKNKKAISQMRVWVVALRAGPTPYPYYPGDSALPQALLKHGMTARVGLLQLLGIDVGRFHRERIKGELDVFRLGRHYALEVPPGHEGPWTDYLVEAGV